MIEPPKAIQRICDERWPSGQILCAEIPDVRPFVEVEQLILAAPAGPHPEFFVHGKYVVVRLTPLSVALVTVAPDPTEVITLILQAILAYKRYL